jgi:hypothetical protein
VNRDPIERLSRLLDLVAREDVHVQGVRVRLFGPKPQIDADWLQAVLSTPEGIDRLESFGAKFSRMQDTVVDKLLPALLDAAGEVPGTAIDNLTRAERLGLLDDADAWIAMRRLRNRLIHEYFEVPEEMIPALKEAYRFADELHRAHERLSAYAREHLVRSR